jgi:hypothetical protein
MRYLVVGSEGPGFASPEEAVQLLEDIILPSFDALAKLEAERRILAGGLPVGERAFVFIVEASSNEVTPLQSFAGRAAHERDAIKKLKKSMQ